MSQSTITFLILAVTVAVFVWDHLPVGMVAFGVASAASFLTPVATPANLIVMGPGGYRFGDYWKLGLPRSRCSASSPSCSSL